MTRGLLTTETQRTQRKVGSFLGSVLSGGVIGAFVSDVERRTPGLAQTFAQIFAIQNLLCALCVLRGGKCLAAV